MVVDRARSDYCIDVLNCCNYLPRIPHLLLRIDDLESQYSFSITTGNSNQPEVVFVT